MTSPMLWRLEFGGLPFLFFSQVLVTVKLGMVHTTLDLSSLNLIGNIRACLGQTELLPADTYRFKPCRHFLHLSYYYFYHYCLPMVIIREEHYTWSPVGGHCRCERKPPTKIIWRVKRVLDTWPISWHGGKATHNLYCIQPLGGNGDVLAPCGKALMSHMFSLQSVFYNLSLYFPLDLSTISQHVMLDSFCTGGNFRNSMRLKSSQIYLFIHSCKGKSVQVLCDCEGKKKVHSHRQAHAYIHNDSGQSQQLALHLPIAFSYQKQNLFLITFHWDFFFLLLLTIFTRVCCFPLFSSLAFLRPLPHTRPLTAICSWILTHTVYVIYTHTCICASANSHSRKHTPTPSVLSSLCSPFPFIPSLSAFAWKMFELFGALRCRWNRIWISRHLSPRPSPKSPSAAVAYA